MTTTFLETVKPLFNDIKEIPGWTKSTKAYVAYPFLEKEVIEKHLKPADESLKFIFDKGCLKRSYKIIFKGEKHIVFCTNFTDELTWLMEYNSNALFSIIGKIIKQSGLQYNNQGLKYIEYGLRENHRSFTGEILITKDFKRILDILELDYNAFKAGFDNQEKAFEFLSKTPFIKLDAFNNLNRQQEKFVIGEFAKYLRDNSVQIQNPRRLTFDHIKTLFPEIDFTTELQHLREKSLKKLEIANKVNGITVMKAMPGIEPKEIKKVIRYFRQSFSSKLAPGPEYREYVFSHSQDEIGQKMIEIYNQRKAQQKNHETKNTH